MWGDSHVVIQVRGHDDMLGNTSVYGVQGEPWGSMCSLQHLGGKSGYHLIGTGVRLLVGGQVNAILFHNYFFKSIYRYLGY